MKQFVKMIIPAMICGVVFGVLTSCNKENGVNSVLNILAVGVSEETTTRSSLAEENTKVDTFLWCNGMNIEWYNATTRELKLKNDFVHMTLSWEPSGFIVYLGDEKLFDLGIMSGYMSKSIDFPVLIIGSPDIGYGAYGEAITYQIGRGYPDWEYWTEIFWTETDWDRTADWVCEREKNWKSIEPGWNKFIEQLKKEGKYIYF